MISFSDSEMTVPGSPVRAVRDDVPGAEVWRVSWLPGRSFTRDQATTAMVLASILSAGPVADRVLPHVRGWAAELGLSSEAAADAFAVAVPPGPERDRIAEDVVRANAEALARRALSSRGQVAVRESLEEGPVAEAQEF